jgi:hypothetical protein
LSKPPDLGSLDHTTANLLQMSVPDPSTTFLDIGTDLGGASLYEDDPFSLEHLLPSNFNMNQLDLAQSPGLGPMLYRFFSRQAFPKSAVR